MMDNNLGAWISAGQVEADAAKRTAAAELRQMFCALTQEGFTEHQALVIIGQILSANSGA